MNDGAKGSDLNITYTYSEGIGDEQSLGLAAGSGAAVHGNGPAAAL
jgi:hypothetical protein